jgi:SET domain-containing protein
MNFGSKLYESDEENSDKPKVVGIHQPSGLLRRSHTKHSTSKVAFGKTPDKGIGVFAKTAISNGELIEVAPILLVDSDVMTVNNLNDYVFTLNKEEDIYAVALGYGSLYNHSENPNADWNTNMEDAEIRFIAKEDIQEGQEITVSYGSSYWETRQTKNK